MRRLLLHLLCFGTFASLASAQRSIDVTGDVVQFRGANGTVKWEFQYAFADTALRYVIAPSGFIGELYCRLELSRDTGLVHVDEWVASVPSPIATPSHRQFYSGVRSVNLPNRRMRLVIQFAKSVYLLSWLVAPYVVYPGLTSPSFTHRYG